jgi:hypothetical protein
MKCLLDGQVEIKRGDLHVATASQRGAVGGEISALLNIPHTA